MTIHDLRPAERAMVDHLRSIVAHGFGQIQVLVDHGNVDILPAPRLRFAACACSPKGIDKP